MANLIVEIQWDVGVAVELVSLRDNHEEMVVAPINDDDGAITLQWEADDLIAHFIDWDLWSGNQTMKNVKATAHWERGKPRVLAKDDKAEGRWKKGGDL